MRFMLAGLLGGLVACEGSNASRDVDGGRPVDARELDARSVDASPVCDPMSKFGSPLPVMGVEPFAMAGRSPRLTSDELAIYFEDARNGENRLYIAHRGAAGQRFEEPNLVPVPNAAFAASPTVSSDGLSLWFDIGSRLYFTNRSTTSDDFIAPTLDPYLNADGFASFNPFLTADGEQLWFNSNRPTAPGDSVDFKIWRATREARSFTTPRVEPAFNGTLEYAYHDPVLSADRLTIYVTKRAFASDSMSIWRSHRRTIHDPFPAPIAVDELSVGGQNTAPGWLSVDNCRMYLSAGSLEFGFGAIYMATRLM